MKLFLILLCLCLCVSLSAQEDKTCCGKCADKCKACAECKDGKMCDKCTSKDKPCPECKDGKMCDKCAAKAFQIMMESAAKYGQPGEAHKKLDSGIGSWTSVSKMYDFNGNVACSAEGTSERKWIMGGRYVQEEYKDKSGFEGICILGYDNLKKCYFAVWYDNMGTGIGVSEGTYDENAKIFTMISAPIDCPITKKTWKYKSITRAIDANQSLFEMICIDCSNNKEWKMMEILYTKK